MEYLTTRVYMDCLRAPTTDHHETVNDPQIIAVDVHLQQTDRQAVRQTDRQTDSYSRQTATTLQTTTDYYSTLLLYRDGLLLYRLLLYR